MISKADLEKLNEYRTAPGRVLSVYLDVDQSKAANLNRNFETAFETKVQAIERTFEEEYEARDFNECVIQVRNLLSKYEPRARGVVVFARSSGGPAWFRELNIPLVTDIRWGNTAYVQQFLEVLDEFQTYGVVVLDRSRARIFTVTLGNIQKHSDIFSLGAVRHIKTTGTDHLHSQSRFQRKADQHSFAHLKCVVELLKQIAKSSGFERLVLAGSTEATSDLFRLLPKPLRSRVVASAVISANAPEKMILDEVASIAHKAERSHEIKEAETLITAAAKEVKAVTSLPETLKALNQKNVRELVYAEGFAESGGVCQECHAVFPSPTMNCEFCGLPVKLADDLIDAAIGLALAEGSRIEQLRGKAAEKLRAAGGIGAFLRF
jgi:peptide chain release factor subunit 1